jgi:hypothetical protein
MRASGAHNSGRSKCQSERRREPSSPTDKKSVCFLQWVVTKARPQRRDEAGKAVDSHLNRMGPVGALLVPGHAKGPPCGCLSLFLSDKSTSIVG